TTATTTTKNKKKIKPSPIIDSRSHIGRPNKILISYLRTQPSSTWPNYSIEFANSYSFWIFYVSAIIVSYLLYKYTIYHIINVPPGTFVNISHALVNKINKKKFFFF